ncbi:MAG: SDR family NAD(P)-dependent oxidoreductase [Anaerolineales bacterium]
MAQVLVTGGAGFIGSHLVHALVERGDSVRVFDNFSSGSRQNLKGLDGRIQTIEGDLRDREQVRQAVHEIDLIFHQAAFVSVPESIEKPSECFHVNAQGTVEVLEAARLESVRHVVLASSAAVYGDNQNTPLQETLPSMPLSPYASSKLFNENLATLYTNVLNLPVTALRYFNVFGPRQSPNSPYAAVIPKFIDALSKGEAPIVYGNGMQTRDFVFVEDVVRANIFASENTPQAGRAYNICSGKETSLLDLLEILSVLIPNSKAPKFADPRLGDVARSIGDPTLAETQLGFKTRTSLADGLRRCVEAWPN